jgi:hypothetical protein
MTWPYLEVSIVLLPWAWRAWCYWDGYDGGSFEVHFGPLKMRGGWNKRPFYLEHKCSGSCDRDRGVHDSECPVVLYGD